MYSRKTGVLYNESEVQRKINDFNNNLREQYRQRNVQTISPKQTVQQNKKKNEAISEFTELLTNDNVIIIGLIVLLLAQEEKDFLLIGVLAILLFLNR